MAPKKKKIAVKKVAVKDLDSKKGAQGGSLNFTRVAFGDGSVRVESSLPAVQLDSTAYKY